MSGKRITAKAAGVLGSAVLAATLFAAPASAATFKCSVTFLNVASIEVMVQAPTVQAAEALVRLLIPTAATVSCQAA
ncbi:hypothetical protein [Streptosporangium carneum]|uniref:Uncharacterized protein n=1 Tax=Streptosporangium carneum TaxID=47481 RepID=A0A9W6MFL6_9ACTN|nr:hypothetical protein [Streptosporangium carneum]GLK12252.1 hypothetical protein GCM10017600_56610 [Streptosporangium carneum]